MIYTVIYNCANGAEKFLLQAIQVEVFDTCYTGINIIMQWTTKIKNMVLHF